MRVPPPQRKAVAGVWSERGFVYVIPVCLFHSQVIGSAEETSRLLLCEATAVVMRQCFGLLGIQPVYKI